MVTADGRKAREVRDGMVNPAEKGKGVCMSNTH